MQPTKSTTMPSQPSSESSSSTSEIPVRARREFKNDTVYLGHLSLLKATAEQADQQNQEIANAPLFTVTELSTSSKSHILESKKSPFPQHGLISGLSDMLDLDQTNDSLGGRQPKDPRVFFNITTPSSTFICGSQGSGKSHTLSCFFLENCLIPSTASKLPRPLNGVVFHYDTFISDDDGSPCEAAFLASNDKIRVRVLCSPTNFRTILRTYDRFDNVTVEPLLIGQEDLNTKRMLDLMAVSNDDGPLPLYLRSVYRILREMRMEQQEYGEKFDYAIFKSKILGSGLTPNQVAPLEQRLHTLESFMPKSQTAILGAKKKKKAGTKSTDWTPEAGSLTIVDLSCPCVTPETACALFNVCLSIFIERKSPIGKVIALDEAHKFMGSSAEAEALTNTLLSSIRLQRHLAARIFISTQEPTISSKLLDLCTVTVVHRFTSPDWLRTLQHHIAGASTYVDQTRDNSDEKGGNGQIQIAKDLFNEIVTLRVGQALIFSPNAIIGWQMKGNGEDISSIKKLGSGFLKVQMRSKITEDGGKSVMAR